MYVYVQRAVRLMVLQKMLRPVKVGIGTRRKANYIWNVKTKPPLVSSLVFLQMIFSAESLTTHCTRIGSNASMNATVASQFFVARKRFATVSEIAHEWPLAYITSA